MPDLWSKLGLDAPRGFPKSFCSTFREDHNPSASIFKAGRFWFYKDHATGESFDEIGLIQRHTGCARAEAIKAFHELAGVPMPRDSRRKARTLGKIVAVYAYLDAAAQLLFQIVRYDPKDFRPRRPAAKGMQVGNKIAKCDPEGNWWLWTLQGIEPVLYRLPELLAADLALPVIICEGEADCLALSATSAITTTAPLGAGKWRHSYSETLRGRDVIIAADRDPIGSTEAGQNHVLLVAKHLRGYAKSIRVLDWSMLWPEAAADPTRKLDISLWLESQKHKTKNA